jgi:hypothetical protein
MGLFRRLAEVSCDVRGLKEPAADHEVKQAVSQSKASKPLFWRAL